MSYVTTATIDNFNRVAEIMGRSLFDDFNYISVHRTEGPNVERHDNGTIIIKGDLYDDEIVCIHRDSYDLGLAFKSWRGVTQPGAGVRSRPYNGTDGAGTLAPGFYRRQLAFGKWGNYDALIQQQTPYYVFRDPNRDEILDLVVETIGHGWGFQTHRRRGDRTHVKRSFGGCQGTLIEADFEAFINLFKTCNPIQECSHWVIYSHWLRASNEQIKEEFAILQEKYKTV